MPRPRTTSTARKRSTPATRTPARRTRKPAARASSGRKDPKLDPYKRKRRFDCTTEPPGKLAARAGHGFVVQKHDATRLHYDFRLELDGVLKSWAVPKGPSLDPADKRLAMQTEDHPVAYGSFEGVIPAGEYGAGPVIVWDRGTWTPLEDPRRGLKKGSLKFVLAGERLQGKYSLVRLKTDETKSGHPWLLIKGRDRHAKSGRGAKPVLRHAASVLSGRTIEQVAGGQTRQTAAPPPKRTRTTTKKTTSTAALRRRPPPRLIEPQFATLVDRVPPDSNWIYEIKFDGYRMLATATGDDVRLTTRTGLDWTARFPAIEQAVARLALRGAVLDGEICCVLDDGRTDFQQLQNVLREQRTGPGQARLAYFVFDLLFDDGEDLREQPLAERKRRLAQRIGNGRGAVRFSEDLRGDASAVLRQACSLGLEGLIGKRPDRAYRAGRGGDWIKLKCKRRQEFVIVGMTAPAGSRHGFGALLLAVRSDGALRFAGKVGTGFSERSLRELNQRLSRLVIARPPLANPPRLRNVRWVRPELVCEISFTEMTRDGILRHPSFQGLRDDKPALDVGIERALPVAAAAPLRIGGVRITHPERVMDESSGLTKGDIARYHAAISAHLLPFAKNRPLTLLRCPHGAGADCFYQRAPTAGFSTAIGHREIAGHKTLHVTRARGVYELVQFDTIELHGWGSRLADIERPDWIVFDLDPDPALDFARVVEAALEMRELLASLDLASFVKTTGGKGLHVVVPLTPRLEWDEVKGFARGMAEEMVRRDPARYVAQASKRKRGGRIFVDWLRNARSATAVLPYSPRARPGLTVAMPLAWKDIERIDPREFTIATVPAVLAKRRRDPWAEFVTSRQDLAARLHAAGAGQDRVPERSGRSAAPRRGRAGAAARAAKSRRTRAR